MNRNGTHSRRHSGPSRRLLGAAVAAVSLALLPAAPAFASAPVPVAAQQTLQPPPDDSGDGPATAPATGAMPAITVEGDRIMRGGQPWWFLGYNSFVWSGDCGNDDEKMSAEDVDAWFASMRHDGHGAVRLFFFDGWNLDRLDAAVASAKEHNVYLTITLDDAIGGCGENDKEAGWFADQSERDTFRAHMEMLLERYKGETAFAWFEFFNEPSYRDGALREFYDEMGAAADAVDPDRLFSSGTVAPYWLDGEDNFRDVHESPGVDIASLHEYDEGEIESNHGPGVRANSGGKPTIVGEYGITAGEGCDVDYAGRADLIRQKAEVYTDTSIGYAGALAWAWQPNTGGCDISNLDEDELSQESMRTFGLDDVVGEVGDTVGDVTGDPAGDGTTGGDTGTEAPAEPGDTPDGDTPAAPADGDTAAGDTAGGPLCEPGETADGGSEGRPAPIG